jgi:sugar/nucleoside kinase (ribokinase family)
MLVKKFDVVGFGSVALDYICFVNSIANYHQSTFISDVKIFGGGCVPTALVTLQRLGGRSAFISILGDDLVGKRIVEELEKENIYCDQIELAKNAMSPFSFIQVNNRSGKRSIAYYQGPSQLLKFNKEAKELIKKGKIFTIDGFVPQEDLKAVKYAHEQGLRVMLDANKILAGTKELLPHIDYLVTSEAFLFEYSGKKDIEFSLKKIYGDSRPEILVTTLGSKGSVALIGNEIVHVDSFNVKALNTTGAGDIYHGAFLYGILNRWSIKDIMIFSSAAAAIKCMSSGGRKGIPDYRSTLNFLEERNVNVERFEPKKYGFR